MESENTEKEKKEKTKKSMGPTKLYGKEEKHGIILENWRQTANNRQD